MASSLNSGGYGGLVGGTRNSSFQRVLILQSSGVHLTVSSPLFYAGGGLVLIVASLLLGWLPALGLGSAFLGLGMIASEFWPAARLMDWGEVRVRKLADFARDAWKRSSTVGEALIVAVGLICAVASGYGAYYLFFGG